MKLLRYAGACLVAMAATTVFAQQTYNPGTMIFKRGAHNQWGAPGQYGTMEWSDKTERGDLGIPIGLFIDPPGVGLTGAGVVITLSGAVGIKVEVWGKNGEMLVEIPANVSLTYPDPRTLRPGDTFQIDSSFFRDGAGTMSTTAPDFGFSLAGLIDFGIDITIGVWIFGGDPVAGATIYNKDFTDVEVGLFNTDLPGFKELVNANDGHYELFGGIVEGEWGFPQVTTAGGNGPGNSLTSHGTDAFLTASISITDAILAALGLPIDLNGTGKLDGWWGEVTWEFHLLDFQLNGGFSLVQDFKFEPAPIIELGFSDGTTKSFYAGDSINLTMPAPEPGAATNNWTIMPTFSMEGEVNNHSQLQFDIGMTFDPFVLIGHVAVGGEILGEWIGVNESVNWKLVDTIHLWGYTFYTDLVDRNFTMKGFNRISKTPFTIEGYKYPTATVGLLNPTCVALNSGALSLNVKGSNFVPDYTNGAGTVKGSTVRLDGSNRTTTFVNAGELNAAIPASDTAVEGKKQITVRNPDPGGGTSNYVDFIVDGTPPVITAVANPPFLEKTANPNVLISVTISGTITDALCGVDVTTGTYSVQDEYGLVQPSGPVTIYPNGTYSFVVRLAPTRQAKDKDGRKYTVTIKAKDKLAFEGTGSVNVIVTQ